jgi:hypothetical protein
LNYETHQNQFVLMKTVILSGLISLVLFLTVCSVKNRPFFIKFEGALSEKKWAIKELNPKIPSDWTSFGFLTFEMKSSTTQRFDLKLYDAGGTSRLEILPFQGVWIRASIPLIHFQRMNTKGMDMAEMWKTPGPAYWIGFTGSVGPINHVDSLGVAMKNPIESPVLEIRDVRLTMTPEDTILTTKPLVDEFGQWIDQPSTGRDDGENYNIGFVDVTDRPYPEMISAAKETFNRLLDVHSGNETPVTRRAVIH